MDVANDNSRTRTGEEFDCNERIFFVIFSLYR